MSRHFLKLEYEYERFVVTEETNFVIFESAVLYTEVVRRYLDF